MKTIYIPKKKLTHARSKGNTACRASALPTTSNMKGISIHITTTNKINRLYSKLLQH